MICDKQREHLYAALRTPVRSSIPEDWLKGATVLLHRLPRPTLDNVTSIPHSQLTPSKLVAEILARVSQKSHMLLSRKEFMAHSGLSLEEMKALNKTTVKRDYQATGKTRKHISKMTALVSNGDDDDLEPEGVTDPRSFEEKEDMILYFFIIEKNH